jgi:putative flippase GtrA
MGVSVITTVISVTILAAATAGLGVAAWLANITATSVATVPSYHLNRRWTWGKRDASDLWREVAPFWALSFAGLVLSTIAVALTDSWTHGTQFGSPVLHTAVLLGAHLSGFGLLWVAQFVLLDRILFVDRSGSVRESPVSS